MDATGMRDATEADRSPIADMLARAFADDPAIAYILPDAAAREPRLPRLFRIFFDSDAVGARLVGADCAAATLWRPPGRAENRRREIVRRLPALVHALGAALPRAMRVGEASAAHCPAHPFWYLHIAGVDPARQGRGLGGAAIRAGLARADADGVPTFLETATERNVALYQALGFAIVSEWRVPRDGPRFWSMERAVGGG